MEDILKADVLAIASELSTLTDQAWVDILAYANELDFTSLDTVQTVRMARILLAAHFGYRIKKAATGTTGPVISEAAGGVRRSYGFNPSTFDSASLSTTPYGMTLNVILSMSGAHGPFVP